MRYRNYLKNIFNKKLINNSDISFSQEGEDLIVNTLIEEKKINMDKKGIFVDIGAHHPVRFSNTYKLYLNGWRGINIDANPDVKEIFEKIRKYDTNVIAGVSDSNDILTYYQFDEPALNTFDKNLIEGNEKQGYKVVKQINVEVKNVNELIDQYNSGNARIELIDIDVEGFDEIVINAMDWKRFRPSIVLAERDMTMDGQQLSGNAVLLENGYRLYAMSNRTSIYYRDNN